MKYYGAIEPKGKSKEGYSCFLTDHYYFEIAVNDIRKGKGVFYVFYRSTKMQRREELDIVFTRVGSAIKLEKNRANSGILPELEACLSRFEKIECV